jgi:hypothetical protein
VVALAVLAGPPPASAAPVIVGQLLAPNPLSCAGSPPYTYLQPAVASGNSYVVPINGTITSWSFQAGAVPVPGLKLKVGRPAGGNNYTIIAESPAPSETANSVNNYPANIPVQTGDVIGMSESGGDCSVLTSQAGDIFETFAADVPPRSTPTTFTPSNGVRFPVQAVVTPPPPSNAFTFGKLKRNTHNGTATLAVNVPGPGTLSLSGNGVKAQRFGSAMASKTVTATGTVKLLIRAKGAKRRTLNKTGKVKVKVRITFIPTGGDPSTQSRKLKLKKR